MTTTLTNYSAKPNLAVIPYAFSISAFMLLVAEVVLFFHFVEMGQEA